MINPNHSHTLTPLYKGDAKKTTLSFDMSVRGFSIFDSQNGQVHALHVVSNLEEMKKHVEGIRHAFRFKKVPYSMKLSCGVNVTFGNKMIIAFYKDIQFTSGQLNARYIKRIPDIVESQYQALRKIAHLYYA